MPEVAEVPSVSIKEKTVGRDNQQEFTHARYITEQTRSLVQRFGKQHEASFDVSETAIEYLNRFIPDREVRRIGQVRLTLGYRPTESGERNSSGGRSTLRLLDGDQIYDLEVNSGLEDSFVIRTPEGSINPSEHGFNLEDEKLVDTLNHVRHLLNIVQKDQLGIPKQGNRSQLPRIRDRIMRWIPGNRNRS